jgi:predicted ATPase
MKRAFQTLCLTGGPGAGKTAVTEILRREFAESLAVVPESASILYGGGFPRAEKNEEQRAIQKAIYQVQLSAEELMTSRLKTRKKVRGLVCDRGTLDGAAYWPGPRAAFLKGVGSTLEAEFARYDTVIHLESASANHGYDDKNPLRTESARQAAEIDLRIRAAWKGHPRVLFVSARESFLEKTDEILSLIRGALSQR